MFSLSVDLPDADGKTTLHYTWLLQIYLLNIELIIFLSLVLCDMLLF